MASYLGFTRFSARLQRNVPDLPERVAAIKEGDIRPHQWFRLDLSVARILQEEGYTQHVHSHYPVQHLKVYR